MLTFFVIVMICVSLPLALILVTYDDHRRRAYLDRMRNHALWKKLVERIGKEE